MAITNPVVLGEFSQNNISQFKEFEITISPDNAYPAGGTLLFSEIVRDALVALPEHVVNGLAIKSVTAAETGGFQTEYLVATDALAVYVSGGTEVAPAFDLSVGGTVTWRLLVRGV